MGKKSNATAVSQISSLSSLARGDNGSARSSSILRSTFAPSHLQLRLFASVIQSFDCEQLRLHDVSTGRLRTQHSTRADESISCLDWGHYGPSYRESRKSKKRKRPHNTQEDVVVAYGTSSSDICMYSPSEDKILSRLSGVHERGIKDFKFLVSDNLEAWSIGGDSKLVQWDLSSDTAVRTISLPDPKILALAPPVHSAPQVLCASNTPFAVHLTSADDFRIESYDAFKHPAHTITRSGHDDVNVPELFLAVDNDRYINVFDVAQRKIVRTLVASSEVSEACIYSPTTGTKNYLREQVLATVTTDGHVELFAQPFLQPVATNGDIKLKRKSLTKRADAIIKLYSAKKDRSSVRISSVAFDGPELVIMSVSGGTDPTFQRLRWQDDGSNGLLFEGLKEVTQLPTTSTAFANMNGNKNIGQTTINEAKTVVTNGIPVIGSQGAAIELSSDDGDDSSDDESVAPAVKEQDVESESEMSAASEHGNDGQIAKADLEMQDASDVDDHAPLSFGEQLAKKHPGTISLADQIPDDNQDLNKSTEYRQALLPSGMSLGTVLTQALRTNDQSLLETCLHVTDANIIQNTILRLDSTLAATLLAKLAERLADRPGRYGHLLTWVQSTMIAHGGAIAGQPNVARKLRTLYQVLNERSKILPNILLLKGKLDMMNAQHTFRQQAEAQRQNLQLVQSAPAPVYIEGDEERWSSSDDLDEDGQAMSSNRGKSQRNRKHLSDLVSNDDTDGESSDDDGNEEEHVGQIPLVNGVAHKANGRIIDDEADESEDGSVEDESSEGDDEDDDEDDSSMESFINDGSISEAEDTGDVEIDDESTPPMPAAKKRKQR